MAIHAAIDICLPLSFFSFPFSSFSSSSSTYCFPSPFTSLLCTALLVYPFIFRYVHSGREVPTDSMVIECTDGVKRVPFTLNVDVELVDDEKPKMTMELPFGTLAHMLKVDKIR